MGKASKASASRVLKAPPSFPMPASTLHSGWLTSRTTRVVLQPDAECPVGRAFAQSMLAEVKVPAAAHDALNCISRQHIVASFCPRSGTCRVLVTADGGVRIARHRAATVDLRKGEVAEMRHGDTLWLNAAVGLRDAFKLELVVSPEPGAAAVKEPIRSGYLPPGHAGVCVQQM